MVLNANQKNIDDGEKLREPGELSRTLNVTKVAIEDFLKLSKFSNIGISANDVTADLDSEEKIRKIIKTIMQREEELLSTLSNEEFNALRQLLLKFENLAYFISNLNFKSVKNNFKVFLEEVSASS